MERVVDLERRKVEALALELASLLREHGSLVVSTSKLDSVDRWRAAARRAGRILGWHVRTALSVQEARVWAASDDFPVSEADHKEAARRLDDYLFGARPDRSAKPVRLVPVD